VGRLRFLLDTHALLWWMFDDPQLSESARGILADPSNEILVSSATAWEIATKHRLGKLRGVEPLVIDMAGWVRRAGFFELAVSIPHAQKAGSWPHAHRDPFDRMLAAQSALEDVPLLTQDPALKSFGVRVVW
jgi:PIN domain nuclease of toxin-antitoxin system